MSEQENILEFYRNENGKLIVKDVHGSYLLQPGDDVVVEVTQYNKLARKIYFAAQQIEEAK